MAEALTVPVHSAGCFGEDGWQGLAEDLHNGHNIYKDLELRPQGSESFEDWLRAVIRKSPLRRTHTKAQILDVAIKQFGVSRYSAEITRTRVIATLTDRAASRIWSSPGPSSL